MLCVMIADNDLKRSSPLTQSFIANSFGVIAPLDDVIH
jgi:hypothetical protein